MKKLICLAAIITLVTGLCFAKPVFKTVSGPKNTEIELAYTNNENDVVEIVNLFKMFGKTRDDKRLDFKMSYVLSDISLDYVYCVVSSGKSFTVLVRKIQLSQLAELNPQVYWLEENDDLGCVFLDCDRLPVDKDLVAGTVEQAIEHGHTHLCPKCQERLDF